MLYVSVDNMASLKHEKSVALEEEPALDISTAAV